jgi:hypothetical protein
MLNSALSATLVSTESMTAYAGTGGIISAGMHTRRRSGLANRLGKFHIRTEVGVFARRAAAHARNVSI